MINLRNIAFYSFVLSAVLALAGCSSTLHEFQRLQVLPIRLPSEFVLAATTQAGISVVGPSLPL